MEGDYHSRECPSCHSIKSRIISYIGVYTCMDCGHSWKKNVEKYYIDKEGRVCL